jgi:hypothetical protein
MDEDYGLEGIEDFEYFESKEHKKEMILSMHGRHFNIFADAIREPVEKLKLQIETDSKQRNLLYEKLSGEEEPTPEDLDMYEGIADLSEAIDWNYNQLYALNEMRVIYLFKDIEIEMKSLLNTAFSRVNIRKLFNWEIIATVCKENGIKLEEIDGYKEVNELRQINNSIKHSDFLDDNCLNILGLNKPEEEDFSEGLESFCNKVEPKIAIFKEELAKKVANELYEFPKGKLDGMAQDLTERMDKEDAINYIERLKYWFSLKD